MLNMNIKYDLDDMEEIGSKLAEFSRFEKKFLEERKIFLWGVQGDKMRC